MIDSEMVSTPGGTLHVRVIGSGPPVLLLHGFPDSSLGFRELCESLAARGFRAIAPDLLGYGLSDKPTGIAPYRATAVVEDLAALVRWAGGRVALLGHDWGGFLAFCLAAEHPELVSRLVILNAPHPESYARALRSSFQLFRAWYILFFQLRRIAEWVVTSRLFFRWMMRQLVAHRELMTESRVEAGRRELLRPGAITGALGYYRAMFRWRVRCERRIEAPTLILWGDADPSLGPGLLDDIDQHVADVRIERVPGAGHFVHWDEPELVLREVSGFLSK